MHYYGYNKVTKNAAGFDIVLHKLLILTINFNDVSSLICYYFFTKHYFVNTLSK